MAPYICYFCNKSFSQRGILRNHFNKKNKCKFKEFDNNKKRKTEISREDMILMFESDEYYNLFDDEKRLPNDSLRLPNDSQMTPSDSQIECEYCHMKFTRVNNKNRHIKSGSCKVLQQKMLMNNCHNTTNNITINNNTQNNIHINCYGKEDLSYITNEMLQDIIKKPLAGIPKLVEMIHLNPDHPENTNIKLVNKNLPFFKLL